jgi:threonine dehydratase
MQKHNKETGPALVGIELKDKSDYADLIRNLNQYQINYTEIKPEDNLFGYLI